MRNTLTAFFTRVGARAGAVWFAVYLLVCLTGQRFDAGYLGYGWQLVPWDILSSDPLRSVWYLHVQPPLWNLLLGGTAWLSPFGDAKTLQVLMALIGIAGAWLAAELGVRLGLGRRAALVVALIATLNPEVLKGAFEPTYELAVGVLLLAIVVTTTYIGSASNERRTLLALSCLVTATTMTRSLYHPLWALLFVLFCLWLLRRRINRQTVVAVLVVPVIVIGGWVAKNQVLFGEATMSSWLGMNLERAVLPLLPRDELLRMFEDEEISPVSLVLPFSPYREYEQSVAQCESTHNHPSLSREFRSDESEVPNFNFECYLPVYRMALEDSIQVARTHPWVWVKGRIWSLRATFAVSTMPERSESPTMRVLDSTFSVLRADVRGEISTADWGTQLYGPGTRAIKMKIGVVLVAVYLVLLTFGLALVHRRFRRKWGAFGPPCLVATSLLWYTILVGAVGELGEQARFRSVLDPIVVVVFAGLIAELHRRRNGTSAVHFGIDEKKN